MGTVVAEIRFEGAAPAIAAQVAALAGLPTHFTDHLTSPSDAHPPLTIPMLLISILRHLITLPSRLTEAARHINQLKRTTPPTAAPRQSPPP